VTLLTCRDYGETFVNGWSPFIVSGPLIQPAPVSAGLQVPAAAAGARGPAACVSPRRAMRLPTLTAREHWRRVE